MEPLTLKVLNDQIISMRKEVKRAVVRQIHHTTRNIRKLKMKKGTDEQKQKNASKANNLTSEIHTLKNIKLDDVSVFGLSNLEENDLKAFMNKQIIAPETKVMAKLCLQINLRSAINKFIAAHSVDINLLNKRLEERIERKEKKEKKGKKKKKMVDDNIANGHSSDSGESVPDLVLSELSDSNLGSLNKKNNLLNGNNRKYPIKMDQDSDNVSHLNYKEKVNKKPENFKKSESQSSNLEIKNIPINCDFETNARHDLTKLEATSIESGKVENQPSERKNVDPFFLTKNDIIAPHSVDINLLNKPLEGRFERKEKKRKIQERMVEDNIVNGQSSDSGESVSDLGLSELSDSNLGSLNKKYNLLNGNNGKYPIKMDQDSDNVSHLDYKEKVNKKTEKFKKSDSKSSNLGIKNIPINGDFETNARHDLKKLEATSIESGKVEIQPFERKNVDPFFFTKNYSEYRTYANIVPNAERGKEENSREKHNTSQYFTNNSKKYIGNWSEQRRNGYFNRNNQNPKFDNKRTITHLGGDRERSFVKKGREISENFPSGEDSTLNVKLHPSWEAKKKMSLTSVPFRGKKITFEE